MKKMKGFQTFIAIALAVMMVLPCFAALAEGDEPEEAGGIVGATSGGEVVNNYNTGDVQTNASTVGGEVWVGKRGKSDVVEIQENGKYAEEFKILNPGDSYPDADNPLVTYETDNPVTVNVDANIDSSDYGISVNTTATVNVSENKTINAKGNGIDVIGYGVSAEVNASGVDVTSGGRGIGAVSDTNGSASVTAGNVTSSSQLSGASGIYAKGGTSYGPGTTTVTAETVTSENCNGVYASSNVGGTATVNVTGNEENPDAPSVTATKTGVEASSEGSKTDDSGTVTPSTTTVTITGDVVAGGKGVEATSENGGQTTVTVTGSVTNTNGGECGVMASGSGTLVQADSVNGDVNAMSGAKVIVNGDVTGRVLGVFANGGATVTAGNITGEAGVEAGGNNTVITATGTITGTGDYHGVLAGYGATVNAKDIIAAGTGVEVATSGIDENNGLVNVTANSITADGDGINIDNTDGATNISIDGDVDSGKNGIVINGNGDNVVFITGTVSGEQAGIELAGDTNAENTTLTAWQVTGGNEMITGENNGAVKTFAAAINYIVKLAKGLDNNNVSTAKGNTVFITEEKNIIYGNETEEDYTYHTAVEDEQVSLTFDAEYDPDKGDTLNVLYNADDENSAMTQGTTLAKGIFTLTGNVISLLMNRGGGMKLAASVNHAHKYDSVVTKPTCTAGGYTTHTCSRCGHTYTDSETPANGHTEVTDPAVPATCTESGLTAGKHCSACSAVLVAQEVIPAGHTPGEAVLENEKAPKDGKAGSYDEVVYCKVCDEELSRKTVIVQPEQNTKQGRSAEEDEEDDDAEGKPVPFNPDALEGWFLVNGQKDPKVNLGKANVGLTAEMQLKAAMSAGWMTAFTFNLSVNGKSDNSLKEGTLCLKIPGAYQKAGREFALLGLDKYGKVTVFKDTDTYSAMITANIKIEGYQFMLIYKD